MNDRSVIREWLFKGLSIEDLLDSLEADGLAVRAENDPGVVQRVMPLEDFSVEIRRAALQALPAYLAFFCLENAVRELVVERMTEAKGADWWATGASTDLRNKVESRQQKEGTNRWHIRRGAQEIYYTDFGDLTTIIRNNWAVFEDLFPDQNWITNRLAELEASRNIIAHSNTLDERELTRVRMYLQDWTRQVG
ncbi:MAG TPA: Swt1 family HEPN domain-containing protein [Jatrophihabitans sp.]